MPQLSPAFDEIVRTHFPGALPESAFVRRCALTLIQDHGFTPQNTLPCVGVCRDQLCRPLSDKIRELWSEPFDLSALGGFPTLGRTGLAAARANAPRVGGRARLAFFLLSHLGLGPEGEIGLVERLGLAEPSPACGALVALLREGSAASRPPAPEDWGDSELSLLRRHLARAGALEPGADLLQVTKAAHRVGLAALEALIGDALDKRRDDYAVVAGVQIHGPGSSGLVWPGASYIVVGGRRAEIWC